MKTTTSSSGKTTYIEGHFDNIFGGRSEAPVATISQVTPQYAVGGCRWALSDGQYTSWHPTKKVALAVARKRFGEPTEK